MNKITQELVIPAIWIFNTICLIRLGLEVFLFNLSDYNVYRVLDMPIKDFLFFIPILSIQYLLLKRIPRYVDAIWQQKKTKRYFYILIPLIIFLTGLYAFIPSRSPFWMFFVILVSLIGYAILHNKLANSFQKALFLLLFAAGLNGSLIFWMHEEANEGRHIEYARQLAEKQDTIAENHIARIGNLALANNASEIADIHDYWEKEWLKNNYLQSNYHLSIQKSQSDSIALEPYHQPILILEDKSEPKYEYRLAKGYTLSFALKTDFRRSVYSKNQPFKNLEHLGDYKFVVVDHSNIILSNTHGLDRHILDIPLPDIGKSKKIEWEGYDLSVYHHSADVYVVIGEPLSEFQVWISNFALFFSLFLLFGIVLEIIALLFIKENIKNYWKKLPIQFKIQLVLISLACLLFFTIAITTFIFLKQNNEAISHEIEIYIAETLRDEILEEQEQYGWDLKDFDAIFLTELANRKQCDIDLYDKNGKLLLSSVASAQNSLAPNIIEQDLQKEIAKNKAIVIVNKEKKGKEYYFRTYFGVSNGDDFQGFVAINSFESEIGTANDIPVIMSKLLDVYVFLLLIALAMSLVLINLLTRPLELLANRLSNFKLGTENEKLEWAGDDAIGKLIHEYNAMVDKVEQTTKELVLREKEGAWQVMAQQIAHEINNQLTPLKLNIQFINRILSNQESDELGIVKRMANNVVEQVDKLAEVASQFKLFAKLENPEKEPIDIRIFMEEFYHSYPQKETYNYLFKDAVEKGYHPIIHIQNQHLKQILQHIITNAEDALIEESKGIILLQLKTKDDKIIIEIKDNGNGINPEILDKIFEPKFSVHSSKTGLGLPVSKRLVEFYHGNLTFDTNSNGTSFSIIFPVVEDV